jgi:endoglucanase
MISRFSAPFLTLPLKAKRNLWIAKRCLSIGLFIFGVLQSPTVSAALNCEPVSWALWNSFKNSFIEADGRVIAGAAPQFQSFSEGQSYAMVFALIANDPKTFDLLWRWSMVNLANNNIDSRLPAWTWGKAEDGTWKILDENSASDADIWYAYALLEAGRLWQRSDYIADANKILALVENKSIVILPGLGKMLLPGPFGFTLSPNQWQLNPSYLPIPVLRRLALNNNKGPWSEIAINTDKMITASSPKGLVPDWIDYQAQSADTGKFIIDATKGDLGSYDAIRVYLWAGMTSSQDPLANSIMSSLVGMKNILEANGTPPERVNPLTGSSSGIAPLGFSAALAPLLKTSKKDLLLKSQTERAQLLQYSSPPPIYYDYVLSLFGMGWIENRYRFSSNGQINLNWNSACTPKTS